METDDPFPLDRRALVRHLVLGHVLAGELEVEDAARHLHLSVRQVERLLERLDGGGPAALLHGNRGRSPAHRLPDALRGRLVELATTTYAGVNRAHLADLLREREGIEVAERTLRRILSEAGVAPARTRRSARRRQRRERMPRAGMLLQVDGSRHDWLEGRGPWLTLVGGVDDATSETVAATFRTQEDAAGYLELFRDTARHHGLPEATYSDRHGIFLKGSGHVPTLTEQLAGERSTTQVGRALAEAGILWIGAHSPQAKGRVERAWGTFQDRLVSELRLAGAADQAAANTVLAGYLPRHNARFAVDPSDPRPAWRPVPPGRSPDELFCFRYPRRVARDGTVTWSGESLLLPRLPPGRSWAGRSVVVQERIDGSLWVEHGADRHPLLPAPASARELRARHLSRRAEGEPDLVPEERVDAPPTPSTLETRRPRPDHPWRR